jgi:hypothetical protein
MTYFIISICSIGFEWFVFLFHEPCCVFYFYPLKVDVLRTDHSFANFFVQGSFIDRFVR